MMSPSCIFIFRLSCLVICCMYLAVGNDTNCSVLQIVAGGEHTCVILEIDMVKCWGDNLYGQLGYGHTSDQGDNPGEMGSNLPVVGFGISQLTASRGHTCGLFENGKVKCWGDNSEAQLGYGDTANRRALRSNLPFIDLGTDSKAVQVVAGKYHTCVLFEIGKVKCWGLNDSGQLGYGDTSNRGGNPGEMGTNLPFVDLGINTTVLKIVARGYHTCALLQTGNIKCWGDNFFGQLGYGDTNNRGDNPGEMGSNLAFVDLGTNDSTVLTLVGGDYHTCALFELRNIKCWGYNSVGQLGYGDTNNRGDSPAEMGSNLPFVDLFANCTIVAAGEFHTCALLEAGKVKCWGDNFYGQLGYGDSDTRFQLGSNFPFVDVAGSVIQLVTGSEHTCALLEKGDVKCWGKNFFGQLGYGDTNHRGDEPFEMGSNLPVVELVCVHSPFEAILNVIIPISVACTMLIVYLVARRHMNCPKKVVENLNVEVLKSETRVDPHERTERIKMKLIDLSFILLVLLLASLILGVQAYILEQQFEISIIVTTALTMLLICLLPACNFCAAASKSTKALRCSSFWNGCCSGYLTILGVVCYLVDLSFGIVPCQEYELRGAKSIANLCYGDLALNLLIVLVLAVSAMYAYMLAKKLAEDDILRAPEAVVEVVAERI